MYWWGRIQGGARQHQTTQEIWEGIRNLAAQEGVAIPPGMFQAVNEMRSQATGLTVASERLAKAAPTDAITGSMLAQLPYARGGVEQSLARQFHVRVGYTARVGDTIEHQYITLAYDGGSLPTTVGQLYADAQAIGSAIVGTYGNELIGLADIEIGEW